MHCKSVYNCHNLAVMVKIESWKNKKGVKIIETRQNKNEKLKSNNLTAALVPENKRFQNTKVKHTHILLKNTHANKIFSVLFYLMMLMIGADDAADHLERGGGANRSIYFFLHIFGPLSVNGLFVGARHNALIFRYCFLLFCKEK